MIDHDNLEEFSDPANYDMEDTSDTGVDFYAALAKEVGSPVLEIACGTGRVSIPIARMGFSVTGLDVVPGMIEQAQRKSVGLSTRWVVGDARAFDLGEQFKLIFLTGNAFQAFLTNADQDTLLQRVHAHLHDDGLFAFETRNPLVTSAPPPAGLFLKFDDNTEERTWPSFTDTQGREVRISRTHVYDHVTQIIHVTAYKRWYEDGEEQTKVTRTALRYTFPQELAALLNHNGFTLERQYGNWDREPLHANSPSIIVVCRKR
ncbi:MAG: class I SAM-dependent methyltransferase [Chloroflexota bacterium]